MAVEIEPPAPTDTAAAGCDRVIVLAMHGVPPRDLPPALHDALMALHGQRTADGSATEFECRVRAWPRTPQDARFLARVARLWSEVA